MGSWLVSESGMVALLSPQTEASVLQLLCGNLAGLYGAE